MQPCPQPGKSDFFLLPNTGKSAVAGTSSANTLAVCDSEYASHTVGKPGPHESKRDTSKVLLRAESPGYECSRREFR